MEQEMSVPIFIKENEVEHLSSGLWGSVSKVQGRCLIVKESKKEDNSLLLIEKRIFERLGRRRFIANYRGPTTIIRGHEHKLGLLFQYYPLGTLMDFFEAPAALAIKRCESQQLRWVGQILDALTYIHSQNIVHGDFGLHNILVENDHNLVVADFGGSSIDGAEMQVECAPPYHRWHSWRFPIQGVDDPTDTWKIPTPTMDTFALGMVLFELLTGEKLCKGESYDQRRQRATNAEYPDLGRVGMAAARRVIENAWGENYEDAGEVLNDMRPLLPMEFDKIDQEHSTL